MELYGTETSPFTRIARIIAAEIGLSVPLRPMAWRKDPVGLFQLNPAGRIPVLVDGDRSVCDSRVICNYLMDHADAAPADSFRSLKGPEKWDEENVLCMIYGSLESVAILSYFRDPPQVSHPYIDRSRERIDECFSGLNDIAAKGFLVEANTFGLAEAALITSIDVIEGRSFADLGAFKNIHDIKTRFVTRASVVATKPDYAGRDK